MATLIADENLLAFLGLETEPQATQQLAIRIGNGVQAMLETACRRDHVPFAPKEDGRVERHWAPAGCQLYLHYPIAALTAVVVGLDSANPDETLDPTDPSALLWEVGQAWLERTDGLTWRATARRTRVQVTYDAAADLPELGALAVQRVTAGVFRQLGAEDVQIERDGGYAATMAKVAADDPVWQNAVRTLQRGGIW